MNLQEALGFPFRDKNSVTKLVIGGVLYLVPVVGWFFLAGYFVELLRRVVAEEESIMPEWDNWGERLKKGFLAAVIVVTCITVAMLPFFLIGMLIGFIYYEGGGTSDVGSLVGFVVGIPANLLAYFGVVNIV